MIDLHLHLDGSLPPENLITLAKMQNVPLPSYSTEELLHYVSCSENCGSLEEYLKCFDLPLSVLQSSEAIRSAVYMLCENLKSDGLLYAEIRFAPQLHTKQCLTQYEVVKAALAGLNRSSFKANIILCCMRGGSDMENYETVSVAGEFLGKGVVALDLAGAESLFKTENYHGLFDYAKEKNIPFVIHAGEADGPASVHAAVLMGARRIGHGVRSNEDPELLSLLLREQTPIEMCVTSNCQTKAVEGLLHHPIKKFLDMGLCVTVNTDNLTVSRTSIKNEFSKIKKLGITKKDEEVLLTNAVNASFLSDNEKNNLIRKIFGY